MSVDTEDPFHLPHYEQRQLALHAVALWEWCNKEDVTSCPDTLAVVSAAMARMAQIAGPSTSYDFHWVLSRYQPTFYYLASFVSDTVSYASNFDPHFDWVPFLDKMAAGCSWPYAERQFPHQPWRFREAWRMRCRYKLPLWWRELSPIADHFAHLSEKTPGMIAYTPDEDKGQRDVRVIIRPGRYLTKFYPDLTQQQVRDWATKIDNLSKLHFAKTADEIVAVYRKGPRSCMSHSLDNYASHVHPVSVYGDSDLQLAYLIDGNGHVTDRALVWPEKKRYGRCYGGGDGRLEAKLEEAGYRNDSLDGARIRRIVNKNDTRYLVMPYIDSGQSFDVIDDDWCRIGGDYLADRTDGLGCVGEALRCCSCEDRLHEDQVYLWDGEDWCESCLDDRTTICASCHERADDSDICSVYARSLTWTDQWCADCTENAAFQCEGSGNSYATSFMDEVVLEDGRVWSQAYFGEHGVTVDGRHYEAGQEPKEEDHHEHSNSIGHDREVEAALAG